MEKKYLSISAVSDLTDIPKEVLRKWEERYGFPLPERDANGQRLYPAEHVSRLAQIKQLLDDGMRPRQVVPLDEPALALLLEQRKPQSPPAPAPDFAADLVGWVQSRDPALLRNNLQAMLTRLGPRGFIVDAMGPMNQAVGDAWADGSISVKDEHLYTETVQELVRNALADIRQATGSPRILLTTVSGEWHTLGILMTEALMSLEGASCVSLGAQTPLPEIVAAVQAYQADIVALSFSSAFPRKKIAPLLRELRALCAPETRLWAGGSGVAGLATVPRGVTLLPTLESALAALEKYRERRAGTA